jgi:prevent-host-death family protein
MHDQIADQIESWKFTDAKAQLSAVVQRALEGKPQRIVRGGREAVIVVREDDYRRATRPRRNLVDLFSALRGTNLDLDRDADTGRDVPL